MKLYMVPAAPNPTKVMLYIAEKTAAGTEMDVEQVLVNTLKNEQKSADHLARNPFGSLPVLEVADHDYIVESLAIIEYLEERFPQPAMWGNGTRERIRARELERIADLRVLLQVGRYVHATKSPIGLPPNPEAALQAKQALPVAFQYFENVLADGRALLIGDRVSVADCTLQAALQFMRFAKFDLIADYPHLRRWDAAYRQRTAAQAVLKF